MQQSTHRFGVQLVLDFLKNRQKKIIEKLQPIHWALLKSEHSLSDEEQKSYKKSFEMNPELRRIYELKSR